MQIESVCLLIPCHNEEENIEKVILDARQALPKIDIIVIDNASTDSTALRVINLNVVLLSEGHLGKGNAVRRGFSYSNHDIVLLVDGDGTYELSKIPQLVQAIREGADMVVGTRVTADDYAYPRFHLLGNRLFTKMHEFFLKSEVEDSFSGFRAFSRSFVQSFLGDAKGFDIETDLNLHANLIGATVRNVETEYRSRIKGSSSKLSTFRDGYKILRRTLVLAFRWHPQSILTPISFISLVFGSIFVSRPIFDYLKFEYVYRTPSLIFGLACITFSATLMLFGLIFKRLARAETTIMRTFFLLLKQNKSS